MEGIRYFPLPVATNALILSSGGKRHIPLLLWSQECSKQERGNN
jgi:hypothetical protein